MENIRDKWNEIRLYPEKSNNLELIILISQYSTFLVKKLQFHHLYPEFEGSMSLETYQCNNDINKIIK